MTDTTDRRTPPTLAQIHHDALVLRDVCAALNFLFDQVDTGTSREACALQGVAEARRIVLGKLETEAA